MRKSKIIKEFGIKFMFMPDPFSGLFLFIEIFAPLCFTEIGNLCNHGNSILLTANF